MTPLQRIRTYESDVNEALKKENVSRTDIALAEEKRRVASPEETTGETPLSDHRLRLSTDLPQERGVAALPWKKILLGGGGVLAVLLIGGGVYYGFLWSRGALETQTANTPLSPQAVATTLSIAAGETRAGFIKKVTDAVEQATIPLNEVRALAVSIDGQPLTPEKFFSLLSARAPESLLRALAPTLTLGAHSFKGNQLFVLVPVRSYEYAFAGMLQWGDIILTDLGPLFNAAPNQLASTQTATTSAALPPAPTLKDAIIRNKDTRALFDSSGSIIFLYSFLDKETLLITSNDETMKTLLPKVRNGELH